MLKKKEKFENVGEVEPPKDTFNSDDEDEIRNDLRLKARRKVYILNKEKKRLEEEDLKKLQNKLVEESEPSDEESSSDEEEVKQQKEIVEVWYLRIEKNF
jgi:ribosome-binding ATPase YchF (GTP1/OBG family)